MERNTRSGTAKALVSSEFRSFRYSCNDQNPGPPSLIRVFAVRMKKAWVLSYPLSAQRRLWSNWADAQADLSLRWVHTHFVGFVMSRLNYSFQGLWNTPLVLLVKNVSPLIHLSCNREIIMLSTGDPRVNNTRFSGRGLTEPAFRSVNLDMLTMITFYL